MIVAYKKEKIQWDFRKIDSEHYNITINDKQYLVKLNHFYSLNDSKSGYIIFEWNNQVYKAIISVDESYFYVSINGKNFIFKKIQEESYKTEIELEISEILSPLSGTVTKIFVEPKQEVKKNDLLLVIESMKMENQIRAPKNAMIENIFVKEGQKIETNQLLIKLI